MITQSFNPCHVETLGVTIFSLVTTLKTKGEKECLQVSFGGKTLMWW